MNNISTLFEKILVNIQNNYENAKNEIKNNTLYFLQKYKNDNLLNLIQISTNRGYSGVEWIDFWGVSGMSSEIIIEWAYEIVKEQQLDYIIEPYYNNVNHRLGISIKRTYLKNKPLFLPIELKKINIEQINKTDNQEMSNTLQPVSDIIDYHFNDLDDENQ
jgi:hypothetical protein